MRELIASGHVADLILGFMLAEMVMLGWLWRQTGRGIAPLDLAICLLGGAALVLALRAALLGHEWREVALFLCLSLVAHVGDLARRWIKA